MAVLRLPPAFPPHFVAFVWRYHRPPSLFVSPVKLPRGGIKTGLDVSGFPLWSPINQAHSVEQYGPPRFLGSPLVPLPCSWTPAAPPCHAIQTRRCSPRSQKYEGRSIQQIFEAASQGFSTRCLRFQLRFPYTGKTRSRWVASPYRMGFEPIGLQCEFQVWWISTLSQRSRLSLAPSAALRENMFLISRRANSISMIFEVFQPKPTDPVASTYATPSLEVSKEWPLKIFHFRMGQTQWEIRLKFTIEKAREYGYGLT
jgi:hypothetical protein